MEVIAISTIPSAYKYEIESPLEEKSYANATSTWTLEHEPEIESPSGESDSEEYESSSCEEEYEYEGDELKFNLSITGDGDDETKSVVTDDDDEDCESSSSGDFDWQLAYADEINKYYGPPEEVEESNNEEMETYVRQVVDTDGFDVDFFPGIRRDIEIGIIVPIQSNEYDDAIKTFTEFAMTHHPDGDDKILPLPNLVLVKILKANTQVCCPRNYFITFQAKDMDDGGLLKTYQTMVITQLVKENSIVAIFREKPVH